MPDEIEIQPESSEPLMPFASAGGVFELDQLDAVADYLRIWGRDPSEPRAVLDELRAAVASLQAVPPAQRLDRLALLEQASRLILRGELAFFRDGALGSVDILGGAGTPAEVKEAEEEFVPYAPVATAPPRATTWIGIELVDDEDEPWAGVAYRLELPDGSIRQGKLDNQGKARIENIPEGKCTVYFPDLDDSQPAGGAAAATPAEQAPAEGGAPAEEAGAEAEPAEGEAAAEAEPAGAEAGGPCFFELAIPIIPALDEDGGEEFPPAGATLTLRSSGGYERAFAASDAARDGDFCCFRFDDIPEERRDDDFGATLAWEGGEHTLFDNAKIGHFTTPSDGGGPLAPLFASFPAPSAPAEEEGEEPAADDGGDEDDAPNGFELPARYLADLFKE